MSVDMPYRFPLPSSVTRRSMKSALDQEGTVSSPSWGGRARRLTPSQDGALARDDASIGIGREATLVDR